MRKTAAQRPKLASNVLLFSGICMGRHDRYQLSRVPLPYRPLNPAVQGGGLGMASGYPINGSAHGRYKRPPGFAERVEDISTGEQSRELEW